MPFNHLLKLRRGTYMGMRKRASVECGTVKRSQRKLVPRVCWSAAQYDWPDARDRQVSRG